MSNLTAIDIVRKYYPDLAKDGYTFWANINRPSKKEIDLPKRIKEIKKEAKGEKRFWDCKNYVLTGEIYIGEDLQASWIDGKIAQNLIPVFAKYKQVKKKKWA